MKIAALETFHVKPRWLILKISTDEGLVGYGEPVVEGKSTVVAQAVETFSRQLIGQDPLRIEYLWQLLYRGSFYRGGPVLSSAISGIEQALWDIKGKFYNMPVYEMLGGLVRDKIKMYPHIQGTTKEEMIESAKHRKSQGFQAVKCALDYPARFVENKQFVTGFLDKFAAVRQVLGDDIDVAIDFHGRVSPAMAIRLCKELEPLYPMFVEEPVLPESPEDIARVSAATSIPIAAGERVFTKWGFRELLEKHAVSVVQPDACHAGGIFEIRKIAAMAESHFCSVAPHNPLGPVSLAACLQIDACTPNFLAQEHPGMAEGWDLGQEYLKTPFVVENGYVAVPKGPGLGIDVDESSFERMAYDGNWDSPLTFDPADGSQLDW